MRWVRDVTRRFPQRPHYDVSELNEECEALAEAVLRRRHGNVAYPLSTDDLTVLLEQEVTDLDLYADLASEGPQVEGVTYFQPGGKPRVAISATLTTDQRRQNRLRTTLTHELGHVHFHNFLWTLDAPSLELFEGSAPARAARCLRDSIIDARVTDWMEWQAAFVCGALLMPARALRTLVPPALLRRPDASTSPAGTTLIAQVQERFVVSADAARVRLIKLGYLTSTTAEVSLLQ